MMLPLPIFDKSSVLEQDCWRSPRNRISGGVRGTKYLLSRMLVQYSSSNADGYSRGTNGAILLNILLIRYGFLSAGFVCWLICRAILNDYTVSLSLHVVLCIIHSTMVRLSRALNEGMEHNAPHQYTVLRSWMLCVLYPQYPSSLFRPALILQLVQANIYNPPNTINLSKPAPARPPEMDINFKPGLKFFLYPGIKHTCATYVCL